MSAKRDYTVVVSGCDDQTEATLSLTDGEHDLLKYVVFAINNESSYECQPTIKLQKDERRGNGRVKDE